MDPKRLRIAYLLGFVYGYDHLDSGGGPYLGIESRQQAWDELAMFPNIDEKRAIAKAIENFNLLQAKVSDGR